MSSNDELDSDLIAAAETGCVSWVRDLIPQGANLNTMSGPHLQSPVHRAGIHGHTDVVKVLLDAGADPDQQDMNGLRPLTAASLAGNNEDAKFRAKIQEQRRARMTSMMKELGWEINSVEQDDPHVVRLEVAGTETLDDHERLFESTRASEPTQLGDIPFTEFEGHLKQIDIGSLKPLAAEAFEQSFPWFTDLAVPSEGLLRAAMRSGKWKVSSLSGQRVRGFAGDHTLPRSRYHTICTGASGADHGTLVQEMWAYSHISRTGAIDLVDLLARSSSKKLKAYGLDAQTLNYRDDGLGSNSILLIFNPGPESGFSPFLLHAGLPQRVVAFPIEVNVQFTRIEKVIDLRIPATADWFSRVVSRAKLDSSNTLEGDPLFIKCWPFRPGLNEFWQILPAMLTQELGGGIISIAAGSILRRAGANALIFPSARNDPLCSVRGGDPRGPQRGWNLVDYRGAPPVRPSIAFNIDKTWPTRVGLGPGMDLVRPKAASKFDDIHIDYDEAGEYRGTFVVEGIKDVQKAFRAVELQNFRDEKMDPPWWL